MNAKARQKKNRQKINLAIIESQPTSNAATALNSAHKSNALGQSDIEITRRSMPAIQTKNDPSYQQNLRQAAIETPLAMRQSLQPVSSSQITTMEHTQAKTSQLRSQMLQLSPKNDYRGYLKSHKNSVPVSRPKEAVVGGSLRGQRVSQKMRLKPSQILEEAKKDVNFGNRHSKDQMQRGTSSLALLSNYLQPSQSQKAIKTTEVGATTMHTDQDSITSAINERFIYNEAARFKHGSIAESSGSQMKPLQDAKVLHSISDLTSVAKQDAPTSLQSSQHHAPESLQQLINEQVQAGRLLGKHQRRFVSPMQQSQQLSQSTITRAGGQQKQDVFNQHASLMSLNSQTSSQHKRQSLKIQTFSNVGETPKTYIPFIKPTPTAESSVMSSARKGESTKAAVPSKLASRLNPYPSMKAFKQKEKIEVFDDALSIDQVMAGSSDIDDSDQPRLTKAPYQVQLLSVSQSAKQFASGLSSVQNQVKLKQERIIQTIKNAKRGSDSLLHTPLNVHNLLKKSRNQMEAKTEMQLKKQNEGSLSSRSDRKYGSVDREDQDRKQRSWYATMMGKQGKQGQEESPRKAYDAAEVQKDTQMIDNVKLLPLRSRKIFKKAMRELDQVDLVNSDQLPLSRPRIRAILKRMKDNLDGNEDEEKKVKTKKVDNEGKRLLLKSIGKQAERDLFGMLIKEKQLRKKNQDKNNQLRQLYNQRMLRKQQDYHQYVQKKDMRIFEKEHKDGYLSETSSDGDINSFEWHQDGHKYPLEKERYSDYCQPVLGSERPSSTTSFLNPTTATFLKDTEQYSKLVHAWEKRKHKQDKMVLDELLELVDRPSIFGTPKAGNFYNKFQNIDKIIEKEQNEKKVTTLQELAEQEEINEEVRNAKQEQVAIEVDMAHKLPQPKPKDGSEKKPSSYLTRGTTLISQSQRTSPSKPKIDEMGKSPIVEYLKQCNKDKLLPHFMPFKNLQESTAQDGGIRYNLHQFTINTRVAPSIASAITYLQGLSSMSLVDTMLTEEPYMTVMNKTPQTLVSLELSKNEHLTPKCYSFLHSFQNLAHLSIENCNIGDETIAILLELDPQKVNNNGNSTLEMTNKQSSMQSKGLQKRLSKQSSLQIYQGSADENEEEKPFLLSGLAKTLKLFNASKNRVGDAGAAIVALLIDKSDCIETVQLHWNRIRAKGAIALAKAIKKNKTIKVLDLSFNSMGSGSIRKALISDDLKKEEEVDMEQRHYLDKFECSQSAWRWRKTLITNRTLVHVDISFNGFTAEDMMVISDGLRENHTLLGCHVEGNNAKMDALGFVKPIISDKTTKVAKQLTGKEVFDVHKYDRIPMTMENIHLEKPFQPVRESRIPSQNFLENDSSGLQTENSDDYKNVKPKAIPRNCWLCEGWTQQHFKIKLPDKYLGVEVQSVYIHLSFEDFKPMVMQEKVVKKDKKESERKPSIDRNMAKSKSQNVRLGGQNSLGGFNRGKTMQIVPEGDDKKPDAQVFELYRMVPPSEQGHKYYFSLQNPKNFRKETFIDAVKRRVYIEDEAQMQNESSGFEGSESPALSGAYPKFVNQSRPVKEEVFSFAPRDRIKHKAMPRCAFNTQELTRPKSPWSFPKSIFAKYKADNDQIIAKCFDMDWRCSTLDKMIKDPHQKELIIRYLRPKYGLIRETYKHLACVAPAGSVPSMGMNVVTELMLKANEFVDYKNTKLSDVDLAFIATNAVGSKNFPYRPEQIINPERQIIRYQFFEILMRLGLERFNQKQKMSPSEGIKVFYEQYLQDSLMKYASQPWRQEKYWTEDVDTVVKNNYETLQDIYNKFAQAQSPGDPKVLRLNRFIELITASGVCDDTFGAREIGPLFNLAMQTQVDEIHSTRHMDMKFLEFVEGVARIADKAITSKTVAFPIERSNAGLGAAPAVDGKVTPIKNTMMRKKTSKVQPSTIRSASKEESISLISRSQSTLRSAQKVSARPDQASQRLDKSSQNLSDNSMILLTVMDDNQSDQKITKEGKKTTFNEDIETDLRVPTKNPSVTPVTDTLGVRGQSSTPSAEPKLAIKSTLKRQGKIKASFVSTPQRGSRSASRNSNSDMKSASMSDMSEAVPSKEISLAEKLTKYINRLAATCMGQQYSHKYIREHNRKNKQNAKRLLDEDAELAAQEALLEQIGFKATLNKVRYSDQRPPTPKDAKKKGKQVTRSTTRK